MQRALARLTAWVDHDISTSFFQLRPLSLSVGILPILLLGLPGGLAGGRWLPISLVVGGGLSLGWLSFWGWRAYCYVMSDEYVAMLRETREHIVRRLRDGSDA